MITQKRDKWMFTGLLNWLEKTLLILALFLLTDEFSPFINFLSRKPYVKLVANFLTGIPVNEVGKLIQTWSPRIFSLSIDLVFWFTLLMLFVRPGLFVRVRKMLWHNVGIVVLLFLACASWFWSIAPSITLNGVYLVIKITLIGIYISQVYSIEEILDMLVWVIALASVLSILAVWQFPEHSISIVKIQGVNDNSWRGIYRAKNYLGRLMAFGNAILIIYWLKNTGTIFKRILSFGLFILTGTLLFFSNSATSLLALAGMYGALILYWGWTKWIMYFSKRAQRLVGLIGIMVGVLGALNIEFIFALVNRSPTLTGRIALWQILWTWFQKHPLFGFGYNAFWQQLPDALLGWALHAHNGYIEIALGLGLSGLIVFIFFLFTLWKRSFSFIRQNQKIVFFWPVLALIYLTLANITYSVAFEKPDFHWALFVIVAGIVSPSQSTTPRIEPVSLTVGGSDK